MDRVDGKVTNQLDVSAGGMTLEMALEDLSGLTDEELAAIAGLHDGPTE